MKKKKSNQLATGLLAGLQEKSIYLEHLNAKMHLTLILPRLHIQLGLHKKEYNSLCLN